MYFPGNLCFKRFFLFFIVCILPLKGYASGFASLKLASDARFGALGNAGVALFGDPSIGFRNPGGLVFGTPGMEVSFAQWMKDAQSGFLAFSIPGSRTGFGFHLLYTEIGNLEYRLVPSPEPLGTFSFHEGIAGMGFAQKIFPWLSLGVNAKLFYEKIFVDEALGWGLDFGGEIPIFSTWTWGMVLQNVGKTAKLANASISLPLTFRTGTAFSFFTPWVNGLLLADVVKEEDSQWHFHFGMEFEKWKNVYFRVGYQSGYALYGMTTGIGIQWKKYRMDYAYIPMKSGFGNHSRISMNLGF